EVDLVGGDRLGPAGQGLGGGGQGQGTVRGHGALRMASRRIWAGGPRLPTSAGRYISPPSPARAGGPRRPARCGEVAEWGRAVAGNACIGESLSRVRIPLSPPAGVSLQTRP